jgi:alpha/beta superfamily hydrolase
VTDRAIFVPFNGDALAAVVTLPAGQPKGMVLLLQGAGGAPRSHRNRLWTRIAKELAVRDVVTVRMDYLGVGDSGGRYEFELDFPPVDQARAVLEVVTRTMGLDRFAVVGNCVGVPTALQLADGRPSCVGVAAILPVAVGPILRRAHRQHRSRSLASRFRRSPWLRKVAMQLRRRLGAGGSLRPEVSSVLRYADVLILHGGTDRSRALLSRSVRAVVAHVGRKARGRIEVRLLPNDEHRGFRPLPIQEMVVDAVVEWAERILLADAAAAGAGRTTSPDALVEAG